jgi:hypothetical protein
VYRSTVSLRSFTDNEGNYLLFLPSQTPRQLNYATASETGRHGYQSDVGIRPANVDHLLEDAQRNELNPADSCTRSVVGCSCTKELPHLSMAMDESEQYTCHPIAP